MKRDLKHPRTSQATDHDDKFIVPSQSYWWSDEDNLYDTLYGEKIARIIRAKRRKKE